MAERKAQNKWIPPNFDPKKHKSINGYHHSHPLRARARKLNEGIVIIRFEMPYSVWCLHCNAHIGAGVRYNAEKMRVGSYLSSPIFEFRMKCHLCSGVLVMQTDPKNTQYLCIEGLRKRVEEYEVGRDTGQMELQSDHEKERMANDPFFRLEHSLTDEQKRKDSETVINDLYELNERRWRDPYEQSRKVRNMFRTDKTERLEAERKDEQLKDRYALSIDLLPGDESDMQAAHTLDFKSEDLALADGARRDAKLEASIFGNSFVGKNLSELVSVELKRRKVIDELDNAPKREQFVRKKGKQGSVSLIAYSDSE